MKSTKTVTSITSTSAIVVPNAENLAEIKSVFETYGINGKLLDEYMNIDELYKETKKRRDAIATAIKSAYQALDITFANIDGYDVNLAIANKKTFDSTKFKKDHGDMYEQYKKDTVTKTLTIVKQ